MRHRIPSSLPPIVALGLLWSELAAAAPVFVSHAGFLLDAHDTPVNGPVAIGVRLFGTATGGAEAWSATCTSEARQGRFALLLGAAACAGARPLDSSDFPPDQPQWLELSVGGVTLQPRVALAPVPTAAMAASALDTLKLGGRPAGDYALRADMTTLMSASTNHSTQLSILGAGQAATDTSLQMLSNTVSALSNTVSGLSGDLATLTNTASTASTSVSNLSTDLRNNYSTTSVSDGRYVRSQGDKALSGNVSVAGSLTVGGSVSGSGAGLTGVDAARFGGRLPAEYALKEASTDVTDTFGTALDTTRWASAAASHTVNAAGRLTSTSPSGGASGHVVSTVGSFPNLTDVMIDVDVTLTDGADLGVYFRQDDSRGLTWLYRDRSGVKDNYLHVMGAPASFGESFCSSPHAGFLNATFGGTIHMTLVARGSVVDGYINGTHTLHCADARVNQGSGRFGFYSWGGATAPQFDNLRVRGIAPATTPGEITGRFVQSGNVRAGGYVTINFRPCFTDVPNVVCTESKTGGSWNVCKFDSVSRCDAAMAVRYIDGSIPERSWDWIAQGR